jgi:hypothetical protein
MAIGTAALVLGGLTAASGIASGVGTLVGAQRERDAAEEEQRRLTRRIRRIRGNLGLSDEEVAQMEAAAGAEQATVERTIGAERSEELAAQAALGRSVSGRDIFLREQAAQQARTGARAAAGQRMLQAEAQRRAEQRADIAALEQQRAGAAQREAAAQAAKIAGIAQTVTGGLAGGAEIAREAMAAQTREEQRAFDLQMRLAELGELPDEQVRTAAGGAPDPYARRY